MTAIGGGREIDPALLLAARRGDGRAFIAILRHYDQGLRVLAFRLLRNREDVDDAMQEAAIKAFRSLPGFRDEATLGTWLYRITYTTCLDARKSQGAFETLPLDQPAEVATGAQDPGEILAARESLAVLLEGLPADQRASVVLIDELQLDYRQAAKILGIPVGTLASRLGRGRAALRAAYRQSELLMDKTP